MLNKKRGFTLLELTIVMAVTAIMAAGIVTFCVTVKGISDNTRAETAVLNDVANIRTAVSDWISFFDTEDYILNVGEVVGDDGTTTSRLVAVRKIDNMRFVLRIDIDEDKNCFLVCTYPSADEQTNVTETSVPLGGIRMIGFAETVGENYYVDKDGQRVDFDVNGDMLTNGRRMFSCTVQSVLNNSNGDVKTVESTFVVATRRETR